MTLYSYHLIRSEGSDAGPLVEQVAAAIAAAAEPVTLWGIFRGLFGIGSNEAIVVLAGEPTALLNAAIGLADLPALTVGDSQLFEPTVRPTELTPRHREGLYVFRFFDVAHRDSDEIAELSQAAWTTFDNPDAYQSEPQALFREHKPDSDHGRMLLITWYDGFASWQASRTPAPEAAENFRRRRQLTNGTIAFATRLVAPSS